MGIIDRIRGMRRIEDKERAEEEAYREKERREMRIIDRIKSFRRIEDEGKAWNEAYKEKGRREGQQQGQQNSPDAAGRGGSTFSPTFIIENVKKPHFWLWVLSIFVILIVAWWTNFLHFRDILYTFGFTLIGLITVIVMISFILYGWFTCKDNIAKFYIATALFIWMLDLVPPNFLLIGQYLGPVYQGFEFPVWPIDKTWEILILPVLASSFTFAFLYINMVYKIIKKDYIAFLLSFIVILIFNYLSNQLPTYLRLSFTIPYGKFFFFVGLLVFGYLAWRFDKKRTGAEIPEFFTYLYMIFVFSFFWLNTGWQGNIRAWFHAIFIIAFGFGYIKPKESNPALAHLFIPSLLLIDFFGYGLLYRSDVLALQFIPPLVIFVIWYCYHKETEYGTKNYTYPVAAFILLVTFILLMSISVGGTTSAEVPFIARKGMDFKEVSKQFGDKIRDIIEGRLDIATAGLYRGSVERNRYESLGVYFSNIRAADPRFYTDEPITVWGSIQSKTYKDAVIINFSCYRWKDNKKIRADKIIPDIKFPIFTLEEVDTECTFLPRDPKDKDAVTQGANTITFSAEYNFGTDAYIKAYFMDRDRFRAYAREDIDLFKEFGIKDKKPVAVHTNGPVEIGIDAGQQPITVSQGYAIKPQIGITLTNRKEIQDKNKRIITRWEGKIKNITELILLTPPGITLQNIESCKSDKAEEQIKCPCSMPFISYKLEDCFGSCTNRVYLPCVSVCGVYTDPNAQNNCVEECKTNFNNCNKECQFLFEVNEGEGSTKEKYNGYALDVGSLKFKDLNKDIDKHRSFVCRFDPSPSVLDQTPITTRYFRVRARYNYLLENSVTVNIEKPVTPVAIPTIPYDFDIRPYEEFRIPPTIYPGYPSNTDIDQYFRSKGSVLEGIGQCIKDVEAETRVPALVILSIANLESDKSGGQWTLLSGLAQLSYALFGIKCAEKNDEYVSKYCTFADKRQCCKGYSKTSKDIIYEPGTPNVYRAYPNYCGSVRDFGRLISTSPRFRTAMIYTNNPEEMIRQIREAGYATDPEWANLVVGRMRIVKRDIERIGTVVA